MVNVQRNVVPG